MAKKTDRKFVFMSYAAENVDLVQKVYDGLIQRNLDPWFDKADLKPGKESPQIEKAIARAGIL